MLLFLLKCCGNDDKSALGQCRLEEDVLRLDVVGRHLVTLLAVEPIPPVLLHAHDVEPDDEQLPLLTELADVGLRQLNYDGVVLFGYVEPSRMWANMGFQGCVNSPSDIRGYQWATFTQPSANISARPCIAGFGEKSAGGLGSRRPFGRTSSTLPSLASLSRSWKRRRGTC